LAGTEFLFTRIRFRAANDACPESTNSVPTKKENEEERLQRSLRAA
jgi:hypothetical protein